MTYFPRMLDKIRLHAEGKLDADYHANLGQNMDATCTGFLRVKYDDLRARVLQGGSEEEALEWCFTNGRRLDRGDLMIWNAFVTKMGWNDFASSHLLKGKAAAGLSDRDDIQTIGQLFDVEEGRKP